VLDIKQIREATDFVRERLASRGGGEESLVDEVLELDERRRRLLAEVEALKAERNRVSKEIGRLLAEGKREEAEARKRETRSLGDRIAELDRQVGEVEAAREALMLRMPNLPHESVPVGRSAEGTWWCGCLGSRRGMRLGRRHTSNCVSGWGWWILRGRRRCRGAVLRCIRAGGRAWNER